MHQTNNISVGDTVIFTNPKEGFTNRYNFPDYKKWFEKNKIPIEYCCRYRFNCPILKDLVGTVVFIDSDTYIDYNLYLVDVDVDMYDEGCYLISGKGLKKLSVSK